NGPSITAHAPGIYEITAIGDNGCESTLSVEVTLLDNPFDYTIRPPKPLTCLIDTAVLSVELHAAIDSLVWSDNRSSINPGIHDSILVHSSGWYRFDMYKGKNCIHTDSIFVDSISMETSYKLTQPDTLTCHRMTTSVHRFDKSNISDAYWMKNGTITDASDSIEIFENGQYVLAVQDSLGCLTYDTLTVFEDKKLPEYTV